MTYLELNLVYLVVFTIGCSILFSNSRKKDMICICTTFLCVLLFNIIKDWKHMDDISNYIPTFKYICRPDSTFDNAVTYYKMQIGYYWLNKIIGFFSTSHYWFMFAIGCLTTLPYAMLIKKYSPWVWLSCLLYFMGFSQSTYVLRQHSAIGLTIFILPLLLKLPSDNVIKSFRDWRYFKLWVIILLLYTFALLIHPTSVIFLFVICAYFMKNTKWFIVMTIGGGVLLYFLLPVLTFIFVDNTAGYDVYLDAENDNKGGTIIINGFYLVASLYALRPYDRLPKLWKLLFKIQCVIFTFSIVSMVPGGGVAIPRLLMYLTCFNCIFLPFVAKKMPNKMLRISFVAGILTIAYYLFALSSRIHFYNYNIDSSILGL